VNTEMIPTFMILRSLVAGLRRNASNAGRVEHSSAGLGWTAYAMVATRRLPL
jgi:hypothetical protein